MPGSCDTHGPEMGKLVNPTASDVDSAPNVAHECRLAPCLACVGCMSPICEEITDIGSVSS